MGYWGGGWGDHVPETARTVAKAFYEGRYCRRGNCETDGEAYYLEGNVIARRVNTPERVAADLEAAANGLEPPRYGWRREEFSFAGWPTKMTARHLCALGIDAYVYGIKNPDARLGGNPCDAYKWYSREEIAALPPAVPKPKREPKFVNLTPDLFESCAARDVSMTVHYDART